MKSHANLIGRQIGVEPPRRSCSLHARQPKPIALRPEMGAGLELSSFLLYRFRHACADSDANLLAVMIKNCGHTCLDCDEARSVSALV